MIIILFLITLVSPIISIPLNLIYLFICESNEKKYLVFFLSISIGFIVFFLIPTKEMDLFRYYKLIDLYRLYPSLSKNEILNNSDPISFLLFFLVSKFKSNGFLPFFAVLLYYNIFYYAISLILKKYDFSKSYYNKVIIYLFSVTIIATVASGVRFGLATSFFVLAIAYSISNNKILSSLFFIISILSHSTFIFPTLLYFFAIFKSNKISIKEYLIVAIIISVPSLLLNIIAYLSLIPYMSNLVDKIGFYYNVYFPGGTWYYFRIIIFILNLVLLIKTKSLIRILENNTDNKMLSVIYLMIFLAFISIFTLPYYNISIRFINMFNNLSVILFIFNWKNNQNKRLINWIIVFTLILYGIRNITQLYSYNFKNMSLINWLKSFFLDL